MAAPQGRRDEARLVDRVASTLRHRILAGELPVGAKLPSEAELTADLGVSRPVVREAVARLRAAGVVETHQGRGSYVLDPGEPARPDRFDVRTTADLRHLMELRVALEQEAAALAARRRTPAQQAAVGAALDAFVRAVDDPARLVEADFAFHLAVAEAGGNPLLVGLLHDVGPRAILLHRTQLGERDSAGDPEHRALLVHEHRSVADAVARGDVDAARAAMAVHLRRSLAALADDSGV
ncbi:FadR/GntR family transcriptional regulator [Cellulomonas triticagri]|uniref:FadR family transcriptional regulator n=1 Tax=Cellulomonas triticagri TaxID=2483352 RepID=A0A3M2J9N5_9CELL|nr:FadR/GntR family transcriptional regulator [Cellulomonas triticagri]RMI08791.1 FadR family transcriptional regulator [Cellulomonas triticagri]